jgi:hypothetical protein
MMARWIRLGAIEPFDFRAAYSALAAAQSRLARPILLWGQGDGQYLFALIAPRRIAPGREARWASWALAPAIATYRQFGLPAYLDGASICLHGQKLASATIASIGECAVVASGFLRRFPAKCVATPSAEMEEAFRLRLEAQHGWQFDHSWPSEHETPKYAVA